ncbi:hypothetical protein FGO68_gene2538 [Halteria grandinella]|uniref:Uncharacterized protein n=1 Tax=Halteria grandinella TaxID=5974 RepID=A0A8J8NUL8_HALGN|nr:hypothetical protein FGO68_gene2538 [Halteria grandinella]
MAEEFLARAETFINTQPSHGGRRLGSPQVQAYTSNQIQYLIAYYITTFAQLGYQLCYSLLTIGGTIQNPMVVLFNALSPSLYNGFSLTSTIATIVHGTTGVIMAGHMGKTFLAAVIIVFSGQDVLDNNFMALYMSQYFFSTAVPEFIQYAVPALATSSYFTTL